MEDVKKGEDNRMCSGLVTGLTGSAQDLNENDVIRHYDVTGKACPKYFVDHEDAWKQFRKDVKKAMRKDI